jgi:hypothetical protein
MGNVSKLPNVPLTPSELIADHAEKIANASAITLTIRAPDGVITVLWSNQTYALLLFASEALSHDVRKACFGGGDG